MNIRELVAETINVINQKSFEKQYVEYANENDYQGIYVYEIKTISGWVILRIVFFETYSIVKYTSNERIKTCRLKHTETMLLKALIVSKKS